MSQPPVFRRKSPAVLWSIIAGAAVGCLKIVGTAAPAAAGAVYTTFDPPGSINTYATCMSDKGIIAGNYYDSSNVSHGFVRATDGTLTSFDPPDSIDTTAGKARCVNTNGWITGSYEDSNRVWHGYVRAPHGEIIIFDPKGSMATYASGINSDRTVVGSYIDNKGRSLGFFRTSDGAVTSFNQGSYTGASAINRRGEIVGSNEKVTRWGYFIDKGFVRRPSGKYRMIGAVIPNDINNAGYVTGVVPTSPPLMCNSSFVWAPGGKFTEFSPSCLSTATCINEEGLIAGDYAGTLLSDGYIRSANGRIRSFDPPGSTETSVAGCAANGDVAGYYLDNTNVSHGFLRSGDD